MAYGEKHKFQCITQPALGAAQMSLCNVSV